MKKSVFIILIIIIAISSIGYVIYVEKNKEKIIPLSTEQEKVAVTEYYIYGTTLNMKGTLTIENLDFDKIELVLYNDKDFLEYEIEYDEDGNKVNFYLSDLINEGLYLDNIEIDKRYMFIRTTKELEEKDKEGNPQYEYKYYGLENKTEYPKTTYYTMSKYNRKIEINSDNTYQTMMLNIKENKDKEIYDIVIDAGHGGIDPGTTVNGQKETDFTLDIAKLLKEDLTKKGFTVKLTRDEDTLKEDEWFEEYGKNGRAQISHEVYAKYLFSVHINSSTSSKVKGIEIYTPSDINYELAKAIAESIVDNTSLDYSIQKTYKRFNGVYTHNFSESEINSSNEKAIEKGQTPYDITTKSNYLYMIRETGGIMTGAYVDDRNEKQQANDYYNSNIGTEAYLMELGYLSSENDLNIIKTEQKQIAEAIAKSIESNLKK